MPDERERRPSTVLNDDGEFWVFGYGSLIWKVDFPVERKVVGFVKGWVRRFWQNSTDHRGSPDTPGKVVTIIPYEAYAPFAAQDPTPATPDNVTMGVCYLIPKAELGSVVSHLDHREKDGYSLEKVDVWGHDAAGRPQLLVRAANVYTATTANEGFRVAAGTQALVDQIYATRGPSGTNVEYLLELCAALRRLAPPALADPHLEALEAGVRAKIARFGPPPGSSAGPSRYADGDAALEKALGYPQW